MEKISEGKKIKCRRESFNSACAAALHMQGLDVAVYRDAIERGRLEHHAIYVDDVYTYCLILRLDTHFDGAASLSGINVIAVYESQAAMQEAVLPYIVALAKSAGCKDARVFADRPALHEIYKECGFEPVETIYRLEVQ